MLKILLTITLQAMVFNMKIVSHHELEYEKNYLAYGNLSINTYVDRKVMFIFTKGVFLDCAYDTIAHSSTCHHHGMDRRDSIEVKKETRLMALGPCMTFFELTDEQFLLHSVAEII